MEDTDKYRSDYFKDAEAMAAEFEGEWREEYQYAEEIMRAVVTRDDLNVVDLGAGTGYFTRRLANALPKGRVMALDSEQAMVDWINEKLVAKDGLKNVTAKLVPAEDPLLDEVPFRIDVLLMGYTYCHIGPAEVRMPYLRDKVRPKMPEDSLLVVVECDAMSEEEYAHLQGDHAHDDPSQPDHSHGDGAHVDDTKSGHAHDHDHKDHDHEDHDHPDHIPPDQLKQELEDAGFTFVTDYGYDHKPNYLLAFKVKK